MKGRATTDVNRVYGWLLLLALLLTHSTAAGQFPFSGPPPAWPPFDEKEEAASTQQEGPFGVYLPLIQVPDSTLWVNTASRQAVRDYYLNTYLASEGVSSGWSGSQATCTPGTTTEAFRTAVLTRLNYFRQMAGIPPLAGFDATYNQKAQAAALMMSVNNQLSHDPPPTWNCYSAAGDEGAGSSNLYLGVYGPSAISGYVRDPGSGNYFAGHRRWILYPQSQFLGTGDTPPGNGYAAANALWVFDRDHMWGPRPQTRDGFVAWPPPGYVPYQVVYPRWSLAYPNADFSAATVTVTRSGQSLGVQVNPVVNGFGENTLVWEPAVDLGQQPVADVPVNVSVQNVLIDGLAQSFDYQVLIFDPAQP